jgi:hypothetical protein
LRRYHTLYTLAGNRLSRFMRSAEITPLTRRFVNHYCLTILP